MSTLEPTELLALDRLAGVTLSQVRQHDPTLYGRLAATAADERRSAVLTQFGGASAALREALGRVDYTPGGDDTDLAELVLRGLSAAKVPAEVGQEAARRLVDLNRAGTLADPAG